MPWCPTCKNEYKEGVLVCADCNSQLVDSLEKLSPFIFGEEEELTEIKNFLEYNKITGMEIKYDEKEEVYELYVPEADKNLIAKLASTFLQQKAVQKQSSAQEIKEEDKKNVTGLYMESAQRAEENRSSAWTLLIVGGIGLVVVVLGILGFLPFKMHETKQYLVYGIMSALFLLFIVMGFISMKNSKIFAKKAESENSLKVTLLRWCEENLKEDAINREIYESTSNEEELTKEVLYFKRCELIKKKLVHQFINLDEGFLDHFVDEVYDNIFEVET
ncbi:hypothetical protein LJC58_00175 [Lachnospiraceae bacterium OttesenSCG-928-D06]|nr:hypothetical protein [Lachnospiraceae bacterium OttesenSCG-928-D06]